MKKTLSITLVLIFVLSTFITQSQIRITGVSPSTSTVSIKNFGSTTVNIATYRLCHLFVYPTLSSLTLVSGSLNLMPGATVVVTGASLNATASDLGLYLPTGAFTSTTAMLDFVQWGSGGNGRESVAVAKGIWTAGDFISGPGTYTYTGDGTSDNGLLFWQIVTGISTNNKVINSTVFPNPATNQLTINTTNFKISSYRILDVSGKVVTENKNTSDKENFIIDVSSLKKGNYTLMLKNKEETRVEKIVIL